MGRRWICAIGIALASALAVAPLTASADSVEENSIAAIRDLSTIDKSQVVAPADVEALFGAPSKKASDEVLRRDSADVSLDSSGNVASGVLNDFYTGDEVRYSMSANSPEVVSDYVVSLEDVYASGAYSWTAGQRRAFANDPYVMKAVGTAAAEAKAGRSADGWMPGSGRDCAYASRQIGIKEHYHLAISQREKIALTVALDDCRVDSTVPAYDGDNPDPGTSAPESIYKYDPETDSESVGGNYGQVAGQWPDFGFLVERTVGSGDGSMGANDYIEGMCNGCVVPDGLISDYSTTNIETDRPLPSGWKMNIRWMGYPSMEEISKEKANIADITVTDIKGRSRSMMVVASKLLQGAFSHGDGNAGKTTEETDPDYSTLKPGTMPSIQEPADNGGDDGSIPGGGHRPDATSESEDTKTVRNDIKEKGLAKSGTNVAAMFSAFTGFVLLAGVVFAIIQNYEGKERRKR